ncbi:MAG: SpoIIE family protein phosphatase [Kiritimatiellae bacterium]|nr:SpoIIE family protein phosphatase [Kiritimatiellia bacterium]MDW8458721.1 SpoIIE family protein phosphatase [Verrucomicrobiota bacterium]
MRPRFKFAHKILLLAITLIVLTAFSLTAVSVVQFRARLYDREFSSAFTVFLAGANYLTAHYKANRGRFVRSSLDFVFQNKFMRVDAAPEQPIRHLPLEVRVYDESGGLVYAYSAKGAPIREDQLDAAFRSDEFITRFLPEADEIRVSGPISRDGSVPGYVSMSFPSTIEREIHAFYAQSLGVMSAVVAAAALLSLLFARRVLGPVQVLIRAARRVQEGDLDQRVAVRSSDEIGLLGETFNQMLSSLVQRISLMQRMQQWTMRLSKQFDPGVLFETLTEMFHTMTGASTVELYISDPPGSAPIRVTARGSMAAALDREELSRRAAEGATTLYRSPDGSTGAVSVTPPVEIAVPLSVGEKKLGAIYLGPREDQAPYADDMLTTVATLAQHAAMSVENAFLYREIAERERVRQEMKWAREIQKSLLPRSMPKIPSFEIAGVSLPALEVGGDYFDIVRSHSEWHCIVGDVSGKGVPAALIMSMVRSLVHTYAEIADHPQDLLKFVNRKLTPDLEAEMFVTLASVTLKPGERNVTVLRAGHEPAIRVRRDGRVDRILPEGTALGLADPSIFDDSLRPACVEMLPGESIVLFTDGVTEARNFYNEELGYERLSNWAGRWRELGAAGILDSIVNSLQDFSRGVHPVDDVTVLVIKRIGE